MKTLTIPRSSLDGAVNDPLTRLVDIFGDENGHRLFGAAVGDAPAGFLTQDDLLDTIPGARGLTVDGQSVNTIWANMQAMLGAFNSSNDAIVSLLSFQTETANEKVGVPINPGFQKATEFGRPSKIRMALIARGFPYEHFDLGDGYTQEYIDLATGEQLMAVQATILNAWTSLEREIVMEAVFGNANYTDQDGINVKRLYNADGEVPPKIKRWTHSGTHTHYLFGGGAGFVQGDLDTMGEHLVHHGFREFGDSTFILFVNRTDLPVVKAFANFIPAESAEWPQNLAASGIIKGLQRSAGTSGLSVEGWCNDWVIVQANDFPAGYLFGMVSGGPMNTRNVVGKRVHPNPSVRGLRLIEGNRQNYPLYDSVYDGYMGAGVGQRGAAVIMQDAASYTAPTFDTGE
ncbi:MAG: hypothetical protein QNL12_05595 [Acidimicrobiia bacterium]|nr:hypothetical protein [Acidimicrobiia bacterium]MDX2466767.1 hypothetical protein [Acidimicrobiia bacterium]